MTKRQTRAFFLGSTGVFTLDLPRAHHRQPPPVSHADSRGPDHARGHRGQARLAPEELHQLSHAARRGRLLRARPDQDRRSSAARPTCAPSWRIPRKFYNEERDRRLMPNLKLTAAGDRRGHRVPRPGWGRSTTTGWPPRPILVSGAAIPGSECRRRRHRSRPRTTRWRSARRSSGRRRPAASPVTPRRRASTWWGRRWPGSRPPAAARIKAPDYHGKATDAAGYIRESIARSQRLPRARARPTRATASR